MVRVQSGVSFEVIELLMTRGGLGVLVVTGLGRLAWRLVWRLVAAGPAKRRASDAWPAFDPEEALERCGDDGALLARAGVAGG